MVKKSSNPNALETVGAYPIFRGQKGAKWDIVKHLKKLQSWESVWAAAAAQNDIFWHHCRFSGRVGLLPHGGVFVDAEIKNHEEDIMSESKRELVIQMEPLAVSTTEAAKLLGISRPQVYTLLHREDFPSLRVGGRVLISTEGLRKWVERESQKDKSV